MSSSSLQQIFTPAFIVLSICIAIAGLTGLQVLDRLFAGSKNINGVRMFGLTIIINIIILVFLIMSFSKVRFAEGEQGPKGNKGETGFNGKNGGLNACGLKYETVGEKKAVENSKNFLDLKPPLISMD